MTAAAQYLPTPLVGKVQLFVHFSSTVSALNTDIQGAFATTVGTVVVQADTVTGQTSNALVISNDNTVFSVAPGNWVGYNNGQWTQWTNAQMAGGPSTVFTPYFTS
jgi:hypothetical protein